jgi:hypothetical protein
MKNVDEGVDAIDDSKYDALPERVQEALGELAGAAKEGLLALSVGAGPDQRAQGGGADAGEADDLLDVSVWDSQLKSGIDIGQRRGPVSAGLKRARVTEARGSPSGQRVVLLLRYAKSTAGSRDEEPSKVRLVLFECLRKPRVEDDGGGQPVGGFPRGRFRRVVIMEQGVHDVVQSRYQLDRRIATNEFARSVTQRAREALRRS